MSKEIEKIIDSIVEERIDKLVESDDVHSYLQIGHRKGDILWVFSNKGIETREHASDLTDHWTFWGDDHEYLWKGRFEPDTKRLSIISPPHLMLQRPPSVLMTALHDKFGEFSEIYEW